MGVLGEDGMDGLGLDNTPISSAKVAKGKAKMGEGEKMDRIVGELQALRVFKVSENEVAGVIDRNLMI